MKKLIRISFAAIAAMAAVSCGKELVGTDAPEQANLVPMTFTATIDMAKATCDGAKVNWEATDKIAVFDGVAKNEFSIASYEGGTAVFYGNVTEGAVNLYAVYPFEVATKLEGTTLSVTIPTKQFVETGSKVDPMGLVMVGKVESNAIAFKNVVSLAKVTVDKDNIESVTITANDGEKISGVATTGADGVATCTGAANVTLMAEEGNLAKGDYLVALAPAVAAKGIFVQSNTEDGGRIFKNSDKSATFARSHTLPLGTITNGDEIPGEIKTAAQLKLWAKYAIKYAANETVKLGADIDLGGEAWTPVARHNAIFDGQGHSIKNLVVSNGTNASFIALNYGVFKNVTFGSKDDKSTIELLGSSTGNTYAGIIGATAANIENVTSYVSISSPASLKSAPFVGGIVGQLNAAKVSGCENYGDIDISGTPANIYGVAGVVGYAANTGGSIDNCKNYGAISVNMAVVNKAPSVGGIVGFDKVSITNSSNYGDVSFFFSGTAAQSLTSTMIGGIAGNINPQNAVDIKVTNCTNEGTIYCDNDRAKIVGGIIGIINNTKPIANSVTIESCVNKGSIDANAKTVNNWHNVGGIIARTLVATTIKNCVNSGEVNLVHNSTTETSGAVGILCCSGAAVTMNGNVNSGNITVTNNNEKGYAIAAGIIGMPNNQVAVKITGDKNTGKVTAKGINPNGIRAAGIMGTPWNSDMVTFTNVIQNGIVESDFAAGALLASETAFSASKTYKVTFTDCKVAGSVKGTTLSATNFNDYLAGTPCTKSVFTNTTFYTE